MTEADGIAPMAPTKANKTGIHFFFFLFLVTKEDDNKDHDELGRRKKFIFSSF